MTDAPSSETFHIPLEVAEMYEQKFVPSIFAEWAETLVDAAAPATDARVLDAACGTGIVARTVADRLGPSASITGVDLNPAMLQVASRVAPGLDWREGDVCDFPLEDASFDTVLCQMALMFVTDRCAALAEFARVVRTGGTVALVVPASLAAQPAYRPFVKATVRHAGDEARSLLGTYWNCGDLDALVADAVAAGLEVTDRRTRTGTARFESPRDFVETEVGASPLAARLDTPTRRRITDEMEVELERYTTAGGSFAVPLVGHVLVAPTYLTRSSARAGPSGNPAIGRCRAPHDAGGWTHVHRPHIPGLQLHPRSPPRRATGLRCRARPERSRFTVGGRSRWTARPRRSPRCRLRPPLRRR